MMLAGRAPANVEIVPVAKHPYSVVLLTRDGRKSWERLVTGGGLMVERSSTSMILYSR